MAKIIGGIQQIGIGVPDIHEIWPWYIQHFGTDIRIFEDAAEAPLMTRYTGGEVHRRRAALAMNMQSGGGFEIWQYVSRETSKPDFDVVLGDYGLFATRIKSKDVAATYHKYKEWGSDLVGGLSVTPAGDPHFFVRDPNGNLFNIVGGSYWLRDEQKFCGGAAGCLIGVSDIDASRKLYSNVLDYDEVLYDETGVFEDFQGIPGGEGRFRRLLLGHSQDRQGAFSKLLGPSKIELVQALDRAPRKIFENRYWGDWGFIHLCYDVGDMDAIQASCEENGFPFTVDSGDTFDMGEAGGRFSYVEDPDGTLIEFVETHKVPVVKSIGWYVNLKKRDASKPLPDWMVKSLRFNRIKHSSQ